MMTSLDMAFVDTSNSINLLYINYLAKAIVD